MVVITTITVAEEQKCSKVFFAVRALKAYRDSGITAPSILNLATRGVGLGGVKLHAPVVLHPEKKPRYPLNRSVGELQDQLPLPVLEP